MARHYYADTASVATLAAGINSSTTSITVNDFTGWPGTYPFWAQIARGTESMEIVEVTSAAGNVLTVVRGQGGTPASAHSITDAVEHIVSASHFNETDGHVAATTNVHGVTGSLVGTTGSQTILDKEFRGKFTHRFTDALPAGPAAGLEIHEDSAAARDGVVVRNTAADVNRRAYLLEQSGTDRVQVYNDGTVRITPNGAAVRVALDVDGEVRGDALQVDGPATVTGAVATGALTATGNATVSGTLGAGATTVDSLASSGAVSGTTGTFSGDISAADVTADDVTLTGIVTQSLPAVSTGTRHVIRTRAPGRAVEIFDESGALLFALDAAGDLYTLGDAVVDGGLHLYGSDIPSIASVDDLANVPLPSGGQVVHDWTTEKLWERLAGSWREFPHVVVAELRRTTTQSIPNATYVAIQFNAEDEDSHSGHSNVTNNTRYTCPTGQAGLYEFAGGVGFAAHATGYRALQWRQNGVEVAGSGANTAAIGGGVETLLAARTKKIRLAEGDYVELWAAHSAGVALDTTATTFLQPSMSVRRIGA